MTRVDEIIKMLQLRPPAPQPIVDMGCPWSGGALVLRQGPHGDFLGCEHYPECTYTERRIG